MNEIIKEKILEMANDMNSLLDTSVEFNSTAPLTEHFPAESCDYVEINGKFYQLKMVITLK